MKNTTIAIASLLCVTGSLHAATISLDATADTSLVPESPDNNYGSRTEVLIGNAGGNVRAGLLRFDTTALAGATINSMTLRFVIFRTSTTGTWNVNMLREGNSGWVEGTVNGAVQNGSATWNHKANPGTTWLGGSSGANAAADRYGSMGSFTLTSGTDVIDDVIDTTLTVGGTGFSDLTALVDHWNTGSNNAGFQIYGGTGQWGFDSKEGSGAAQLIIDYTPVPEPSSAALLGLGGLALILRRRK
ncbi:MAG: DNRLRE domain-containing protein [Akkermansiaceae bacterium]|nr:DNRLRE domain-containing protein [Akkermansiaceae bacterium]